MQRDIHSSQKCWRSSPETKGHHLEFEMARVCLKCSFVLLSFCQSDLVIAGAQIELGEPTRPCQFVQNILNYWHGVLADDSHRIQSPVIDTHAPGTVLLLDQNNRRREWTAALLDDTGFQHLSHLSFHFCLQFWLVPIRSYVDWLGALHQRNGVITLAPWWQSGRL